MHSNVKLQCRRCRIHRYVAAADTTILPSLVQEGLLKELERIYHPQHNLPIDVKFNLVPLYGSRQTG
jgi:hypothetical protein